MRMKRSAVAGLFYPDDPVELGGLVDDLLRQNPHSGAKPKAVMVPHAGLIYSGSTAARAFNHVAPYLSEYRRVVLLGPSHRYPLNGIAALDADEWQTPLGIIEIDRRFNESLVESKVAEYLNKAHMQEHCLEVQLPFLQRLHAGLPVVPLAVGKADTEAVSGLVQTCLKSQDTLVIVSSDLSHFHDYSSAREIDHLTMNNIEQLQPTLLPEQACGCYALNGLLDAAHKLGLQAQRLAACNSGDTTGDHNKVVGYASYAFC